MRFPGKFDVAAKLILLSSASLVSMALIAMILIYTMSSELYRVQRVQLQELIKSVTGAISHLHHLEQEGTLDRGTAQTMALDMLYDAARSVLPGEITRKNRSQSGQG